MSRNTPFLDDLRPDEKPGDLWEGEVRWAKWQDTCFGLDTVLVGGHHVPARTNRYYVDFEDGQSIDVIDHFSRVSSMMKRQLLTNLKLTSLSPPSPLLPMQNRDRPALGL